MPELRNTHKKSKKTLDVLIFLDMINWGLLRTFLWKQFFFKKHFVEQPNNAALCVPKWNHFLLKNLYEDFLNQNLEKYFSVYINKALS